MGGGWGITVDSDSRYGTEVPHVHLAGRPGRCTPSLINIFPGNVHLA